MTRQTFKLNLLLSAASVALLTAGSLQSALADNLIINSATTTAVKTSTAAGSPASPGDITINTGGSITIKAANAAVTVDSGNNFTMNAGTLSNIDTANARGITIDTGSSTPPATPLLGNVTIAAGNIDLGGSGTGKGGIVLSGTGTLEGDISLNNTVMNINGDGSTAIGITSSATLDGNLDIKRSSFNLTPSTTNGTTPTGLSILSLAGKITGDVSIDGATTMIGYGQSTRGVVTSGEIGGSFSNKGIINVQGFQQTVNESTGMANLPKGVNDPAAGPAVSIGGSILGGFHNGGDATSSGTLPTLAMTGGAANALPATVTFAPAGTTPIIIGVYTGDAEAGFSFYNRGNIHASTINANLNVAAMSVTGFSSTASVSFEGLGIFNSGNLLAQVSSNDSGNAAPTAGGLIIDGYAAIGDVSLANSGLKNSGVISASASGTRGGQAFALSIGTNASLNSITNSGTISAATVTSNPDSVTVQTAYAIRDLSGTLSAINNTGIISATTTAIAGATPVRVAADLHFNTTGISFSNTAGGTVMGDILFGSGADTLTVTGGGSSSISTVTGNIDFGSNATGGGGIDSLDIGSFGRVTGQITQHSTGTLDITIVNTGELNVMNNQVAQSLKVNTLDVSSGANLNVAVSNALPNNISIDASGAGGMISLASGANLGVIYSSFIPESGRFVLLNAQSGNLNIGNPTQVISALESNIPYLFTGSASQVNDAGLSQLVLDLAPKTSGELGLSGYAAQVFAYANAALRMDDPLGAAMISGVTDTASAQAAYSQFAPDASGGTRAIAVSLTDHATGPVAARQRALRLYATQQGETTLWGQEFAQQISDKGNSGLPGFKDSGFGFSVGADAGSPENGWYGGALTFYSGNVDQRLPSSSRNNTQWYMLSGYTTWRGKGLFLDTQISAGYGDLSSHRFINLGPVSRTTTAKRTAIMGAAGFSTGVNYIYGSTTLTPILALNGLTMREEGYTETGGGAGFNLKVDSSIMSSLRGFLGANLRHDINLSSFFLQPELRVGYRYDALASRVKLDASFPGVTGTGAGTGAFSIFGPSPTRGHLLAGASIAATTEAWSLGLNYDLLSGSNGSMTQVGVISLIGRI